MVIGMSFGPDINKFNGCDDASELERVVLSYLDKLPDVTSEMDFDRPTFILAPCSQYGVDSYPFIRPHLGNVIAAVDDYKSGNFFDGVPYINIEKFKRLTKDYADPLAINFANTLYSKKLFEIICSQNDVECIDFVSVLGKIDAPATQATPRQLRQSIVDRSKEYFEVVNSLQNEESRCALLSTLMFKLTYDRNVVWRHQSGLENEYFKLLPTSCSQSFFLGDKEAFLDVGAKQGQVAKKFLTAVNFQFESIHLFESDKTNLTILQKLHNDLNLANFHIHDEILSEHDAAQSLCMKNVEGTIMPRCDAVEVRASGLDAVIDRATFIKLDTRGHENKVLQGATKILRENKPRLAIATCYCPHDLLEVFQTLRNLDAGYEFRFKKHTNYYCDEILYVSQPGGW